MKRIYTVFVLAVVAMMAAAQDAVGPWLEPEGEAALYKVEHNGFAVVWGEIAQDNSSAASNVVFGENGEVYFKIVVKAGHSGYVKGVKDGSKIKVEFPQCMGVVTDDWSGEETTMYADVMNYVEIDGYQWYVNSGGKSSVEFDVAEDGSFSFNLKGANDGYFSSKIIGVVTDLDPESRSWIGFGDWEAKYMPFNEQSLSLPEGLTAEKWQLMHEYDARVVNVAFDGDDVWLGNLTDELPDAYVKGKIENGKATFPLTYLGYSKIASNFVYFVPCYWEEFEFDGEMVEDYIIHDNWVFDYDAENKSLTNVEDYAAIMIGTSDKVGEMAGSFVDMYFEPEIHWLDAARANDPLQDPELCDAYHDLYFDCDFVEIFLPSLNQGNYPLDESRLSYIFYVDGKPMTFSPDVYVGLEEEMTEIPFDFCDLENEDIWAYGQLHQICLYKEAESYTTVGVKLFYINDEGEKIESNYVEANIETLSEGGIKSGIETPALRHGSDAPVFNIQGQRVGKGYKGIVIRDGKKRLVR